MNPSSVPFEIWRADKGLHLFQRRKKIVHGNTKDDGEHEQLTVRHPPKLRFDFCDRSAADIPPGSLQPCGQLILSQRQRGADLPHLRSNDVAGAFHVPVSELDPTTARWCSLFLNRNTVQSFPLPCFSHA
jgi:hypothetical protein